MRSWREVRKHGNKILKDGMDGIATGLNVLMNIIATFIVFALCINIIHRANSIRRKC